MNGVIGAYTNPYDALLDGLWRLLEQSQEFCELVRPANRIRFDGDDRDPVKPQVGTADLPEVRIVLVSGVSGPTRNTSANAETVTLQIQVSSGDQRFSGPGGAEHTRLRWIIYRAMTEADASLRASVQFNDFQCVQRVEAKQIQDGVSQSDLNRGIKGWSALWSIEVIMWYPRTWFA